MADTRLVRKVLKAARQGRDRLLVAAGMRMRLPVESILRLTVAEVRSMMPTASEGIDLLGLADHALAFGGRKGGGSTPISRVHAWRIVSAALRSAGVAVAGCFGLLRGLLEESRMAVAPVPVPVRAVREAVTPARVDIHAMFWGRPDG